MEDGGVVVLKDSEPWKSDQPSPHLSLLILAALVFPKAPYDLHGVVASERLLVIREPSFRSNIVPTHTPHPLNNAQRMFIQPLSQVQKPKLSCLCASRAMC